MRLATDDELYTVHSVFLGPKGWLFPWRARYVAYGVGFALFALAIIAERSARIPFGPFMVAWTLLGAIAATRFLGKWIDYERPLTAQMVTLWHEISAPRLETKPEAMRITPGRVRVQRGNK